MARKPSNIKSTSANMLTSAIPKSASSRGRRLGRSRQYLNRQRPKMSSYYGDSCDSEGEGGEAFMNDARLQHAYYTLIVETSYGDWRFAGVSDHGMSIKSQPVLFSSSSIDKLLAIWERVVIHNAIPWHDGVCPNTLRIVSYNLDIQDVTKFVLGDNYDHLRKQAALMMIEDQDARLLGLSEDKAKQVLFHNPEFEDDDEHLLKHLSKESTSYAVENLLALD